MITLWHNKMNAKTCKACNIYQIVFLTQKKSKFSIGHDSKISKYKHILIKSYLNNCTEERFINKEVKYPAQGTYEILLPKISKDMFRAE